MVRRTGHAAPARGDLLTLTQRQPLESGTRPEERPERRGAAHGLVRATDRQSSGTTSRTLRHYDDIGLLKPSRTGDNGYRHYDQDALVRLQRILLLRELGLGLPAVAEVIGPRIGPREGPRPAP